MTPESGPEPKFWQIPLADLEQRLGADRNGLSSAEVAARRVRYGPNTLEERRRLSLSGGGQSNGGSPTCSATAISRAAIYAARARHSANAAERLCL